MKIEFAAEGGLAAFPGLAQPVTIDAAALSPARGRALATLVERAGFFDAAAGEPAAAATPPSPARDARCYTIAIDDGTRSRRITVREPIADTHMRALVDEIASCAADVRRASRGNA